MRLFLLYSLFCIFSVSTNAEQSAFIENDLMYLTAETAPFTYTLVDKYDGHELVEHTSTSFEIDGKMQGVTKAKTVQVQSDSMTLELTLENGDMAQAVFAFSADKRLTIKLTAHSATATEQVFADQGEHVYGIWECTTKNSLDNRGEDRPFVGDARKYITYSANARAPFYATDHRYGLYVQSQAYGHYKIAIEGQTSFMFKESALTYHIIYGPTYAEIYKEYNAIAGPAFTPPDWALGAHWWRDQTNQKELLGDIADFQRHRLPSTVVWIDRPLTSGPWGWGGFDFNPKQFPDPDTMMETLSKSGYKCLLWIANRTEGEFKEEAISKNYAFPGHQQPATDVRRPEVFNWFKEKLSIFAELGAQGYKIDRGEDGAIPLDAQNETVNLFAKCAAESMEGTHGKDYFIFGRNLNDTGRKYAAVWNADVSPNFKSYIQSLQHGIRCATINFPIFGSDTCGYRKKEATDELAARWFAFSAYCPFLEGAIKHIPLKGDTDSFRMKVLRKYLNIHHEMIPYTRSCMYLNTQTGMAIIRPMIFEFPEEKTFINTWDQYMYGPSLLVAPVIVEGATSKSVQFPEGRWLDERDRITIHEGPAKQTVQAPIEATPVYIREGAIIPMGDVVKGNNNWTENWKPKLRLEILPAEKQASTFTYYTGARPRMIRCTPDNGTISIVFEDLECPGDLHIYCKDLKQVMLNGRRLTASGDYTYNAAKNLLIIPFDGKTSLEIKAKSIFE